MKDQIGERMADFFEKNSQALRLSELNALRVSLKDSVLINDHVVRIEGGYLKCTLLGGKLIGYRNPVILERAYTATKEDAEKLAAIGEGEAVSIAQAINDEIAALLPGRAEPR